MPNVHKDFHGALSYGLQFLEENYGKEGLQAFLSGLASTVYKSLCEDLRIRGWTPCVTTGKLFSTSKEEIMKCIWKTVYWY